MCLFLWDKVTQFPRESVILLGDTDSEVAYIILRGCGLTEIPEGCFNGKYSSKLISLDLTYNRLTKFPVDFTADALPFLYGLDISQNAFASFPYEPMTCKGLTVFAIRGQRNDKGERCLREWPTGIYQHTGLRGFYIGSNDLRHLCRGRRLESVAGAACG